MYRMTDLLKLEDSKPNKKNNTLYFHLNNIRYVFYMEYNYINFNYKKYDLKEFLDVIYSFLKISNKDIVEISWHIESINLEGIFTNAK